MLHSTNSSLRGSPRTRDVAAANGVPGVVILFSEGVL